MLLPVVPMVKSPDTQHKPPYGFTLIEVMVALVIVSIAMTAILQSLSQQTRTLMHLQNKTLALLVGKQILNEAQVGLLKYPESTQALDGKTRLLAQSWQWHLTMQDTPNAKIKKVQIAVSLANVPMIEVASYVVR